ncbi:hypothetical protein QJS10_CPB19g00185 [Acorus calamus]|uniref:Uncharacterized protein n=1 Tax=Acorus calamus TaxID=4465 RepID=A0AAV9CJR5_ACOCL|nr:hypothetical protein QJS10_CPB19g00185 [Acorus calamus]
MNDLGGDRPKSWNIYTGAASNGPSSTPAARDPPWKELGSSMNAISFGFVATAILISMFVIMAIFEHLLRPRAILKPAQVPPQGPSDRPSIEFNCVHWGNFGALTINYHVEGVNNMLHNQSNPTMKRPEIKGKLQPHLPQANGRF